MSKISSLVRKLLGKVFFFFLYLTVFYGVCMMRSPRSEDVGEDAGYLNEIELLDSCK